MCLEEELIEFKKLTLELMETIKIQGNRFVLLKKREELLDKIRSSDYELHEIQEMGKSLKLYELEKELHRSVIGEMSNIKQQMSELKKRQQGNQVYINAGYGGYVPSRFDKKY